MAVISNPIASVQVTINGTQYNAVYNSTSQKWEATITAPNITSYNLSGGYYPVSVLAVNTAGTTATVDSGDATLGANLRLVVKEKVAPTIAISSPGAGAHLSTSTPTIELTLRDEINGSGINLSTFSLTVDSTALASNSPGMTVTPAANGYNVSYTPPAALGDGAHTIKVNVSDNDGNAATQAQRTFNIATIPPVLNITSPVDATLTNISALTITGVTNDASAASPASINITLNGIATAAVTVNPDGSFSLPIVLNEGENVIVITATDLAGQTSQATFSVTLDTTVPQFTSITISPNPADAGETVIIAIAVS